MNSENSFVTPEEESAPSAKRPRGRPRKEAHHAEEAGDGGGGKSVVMPLASSLVPAPSYAKAPEVQVAKDASVRSEASSAANIDQLVSDIQARNSGPDKGLKPFNRIAPLAGTSLLPLTRSAGLVSLSDGQPQRSPAKPVEPPLPPPLPPSLPSSLPSPATMALPAIRFSRATTTSSRTSKI